MPEKASQKKKSEPVAKAPAQAVSKTAAKPAVVEITTSKTAAAPAKAASTATATAVKASAKPVTTADRSRMIAEAAYFLAERRGFKPDSHVQDWLTAEKNIDALINRR